jgi:hypothetical protein
MLSFSYRIEDGSAVTQNKLLTTYLPMLSGTVRDLYTERMGPGWLSTYLADAHLLIWQSALNDRDEAVVRLRSAIPRLGYGIALDDLDDIDQAISSRLQDLTADDPVREHLDVQIASSLAAIAMAQPV